MRDVSMKDAMPRKRYEDQTPAIAQKNPVKTNETYGDPWCIIRKSNSMADVLKYEGNVWQPNLRSQQIVMVVLQLRISIVIPSENQKEK